MTREEAIKTLRNTAWLGTDKKVGQVEEAIQIAIKALEAQDVDAISRQAVMWMLTNLSYNQCKTQGEADLIDTAKTMVITMPSAQTVDKDINVSCKDVISRQAAIDAVGNMLRRKFGIGGDLAEVTIAGLPSAQPEPSQIARDIATIIEDEQDMRVIARNEIIRCKDCKHWREGTTYSYCDKLFGMGVLDIYDYMTTEDDFCSRAERRTDGVDS